MSRDVGKGASIGRSIRDSEAVRKTAFVLEDVLVLQHVGNFKGTLLLVALTLDVKDIAIRDLARGVGASFHSLLENALVPAMDEIGVVSVASRVGVGDNELTLLVLEGIGVPDSLVEERNDAGLIALGASAVHDQRRVSDMRRMVLGVAVLSIPARWEHDFEANTISAVLIEVFLVGQVVAAERRLRGLGVVQTVESKSLLFEGLLRSLLAGPFGFRGVGDRPGEIAQVLITRNHAESFRESGHVLSVKQVVASQARCWVSIFRAISEVQGINLRKHASHLLHELGITILVHEVQRGGPVCRLVLGDCARRTLRIFEARFVDGHGKGCRDEV